MIRINANYSKLQSSYLFSDISKRVSSFQKNNPNRPIIKLGIGDVTLPLPTECITALHAAVDEMAEAKSFKGYGPEQGYDFLRELIAAEDFQSREATIKSNEIFISDGSKCDTANFQELFALDSHIAIPDPVYPVYLDTNVMAGRTGIFSNGRFDGITYLDSEKSNNFVPAPPKHGVDLIYLCFPNNPTGATATRAELQAWVTYAHEHRALILFDAAYEAFIRDNTLPHSIFEIEGAREVSVEFRSFSKTAGFTGTRCAYTVVPEECRAFDANGNKIHLHALWNRRHCTKFNGVSYPIQRAAAATYTATGKQQIRSLTDHYMENAAIIRNAITALGFPCSGGTNAPYIWVESGTDSWSFFDMLLNKAGVVCTPGEGFGKCGRGYIRLSAFNSRENVIAAMEQIATALK